MKVLVCGGRDYHDWLRVNEILDGLKFDGIICGNATGADSLAAMYADMKKVPIQLFPADWKRHGKSAGPIRNKQMLAEGRPDYVVAFPGGKGTANMVRLAKEANLIVIEIGNDTVKTHRPSDDEYDQVMRDQEAWQRLKREC